MYLIAAVFLIVAAIVPEARWESFAVAVILTVVALFGVPGLVKVFSSFTGDGEILANGVAGSATITSLKPTGWRYNRQYPIVKFNLNVDAGGAAYSVEVKQSVDPELLRRLAPGVVVAVRAHREDHKKVVIDWREPGRPATDPAGAEPVEQRPAETTPSLDQSGKMSRKTLVALGLLLFGLIFFRLSCEEDYFDKGGVRVQGVVLKKTYTPGSTAKGSGSSSKRYISYRFTTKEGRTLEGRYDVLPDAWNEAKEGDPVVVEYLSDSPDTNRIPNQRARSGTWRIMALVVLVSSAVLFIMAWRQKRARAK